MEFITPLNSEGIKMEFETFYDEIKDINGTLRITIPYKLAQFVGFKEGDKVKVMIQIVPKKEEGKEEEL